MHLNTLGLIHNICQDATACFSESVRCDGLDYLTTINTPFSLHEFLRMLFRIRRNKAQYFPRFKNQIFKNLDFRWFTCRLFGPWSTITGNFSSIIRSTESILIIRTASLWSENLISLAAEDRVTSITKLLSFDVRSRIARPFPDDKIFSLFRRTKRI